MYTVGTWIYQGRNGLVRDLKESFKWQKKAADAGHPLAVFNVGELENVAIVMKIEFIIILIIMIVIRAIMTVPMAGGILITALTVVTAVIIVVTMKVITISLVKVVISVIDKNREVFF